MLFGPSGGGGTDDATADYEDESDDDSTDSECDVNRPVSPCNCVFIGANAGAGKSSMRSSPKSKKVGKSYLSCNVLWRLQKYVVSHSRKWFYTFFSTLCAPVLQAASKIGLMVG